MADILNSAPQDLQHIQRVTLDGIQYRVRFTFSPRRTAWFTDMLQADDTPIMVGRRMSPLFSMTVGLLPAERPTGEFYIQGFDQYVQLDLGGGILVIFYPNSELVPTPVESTLVFAVRP